MDSTTPSDSGSRRRFPIIRISAEAQQLLLDLEAAHYRIVATDAHDKCAVENAYAALNQRRREVYEYLQYLEYQVLDPHTERTTLRFD